jgi:glycerol-3-phosphate acyltransferase PlsY
VATALGAFLAVSPLAAVVVLALALAVLYVFRYASVMSIVGVFAGFVALVVLVAMDLAAAEYLLFGTLTMLAVEFNHLANIRRLIAGTEPKLGQGGQRRDATSA